MWWGLYSGGESSNHNIVQVSVIPKKFLNNNNNKRMHITMCFIVLIDVHWKNMIIFVDTEEAFDKVWHPCLI